VPEHHPVAGEGIERVAEGGGPVLLEEEVADPGAGIAAAERGQEPPGIARGQGHAGEHQRPAAAREVQAPRGAVGMFLQVEGVELAEAGESGHARAPRPSPGMMPQPPASRSAAFARAQSASWASSGCSASRRPPASARASMARNLRSNLALARRSADRKSTRLNSSHVKISY